MKALKIRSPVELKITLAVLGASLGVGVIPAAGAAGNDSATTKKGQTQQSIPAANQGAIKKAGAPNDSKAPSSVGPAATVKDNSGGPVTPADSSWRKKVLDGKTDR